MFDGRFDDEVAVLQSDLQELVERFDPDLVPAGAAPALYERFDQIVRCAMAARTLLARKVAESRVWQQSGHADASEFLAASTGSSLGAAREELKTSDALKDLPATGAAMKRGSVSPAQGAAIADAAKVNPKAEADLLGKAKTKNLNELRQAAGRAKAAGDPDPAATQARIHRNRRLSRFTDGEGAANAVARGTVPDMAIVNSALDPIIDELYRTNRNADTRASRDAYAFDALIELCRRAGASSKPGKTPNPRFLALIRADLSALKRGSVEEGELCEITGVGPIPVETARDLLGDAVLKLVITRGVDVLNVTSLGRGPTAAMKMALAWSSPGCTNQGCSRTVTEYDHKYGFEYAKTKHTRLDETEPLCNHDHDLKTRLGWALIEGTGKRPLVPPEDPRHPKHQSNAPPLTSEERQARRASILRRVTEALQAQVDTAAPTTLFG